jgi:hypothetical protein
MMERKTSAKLQQLIVATLLLDLVLLGGVVAHDPMSIAYLAGYGSILHPVLSSRAGSCERTTVRRSSIPSRARRSTTPIALLDLVLLGGVVAHDPMSIAYLAGYGSILTLLAWTAAPLTRMITSRPVLARRIMRTHHRAPFFHSKPCSAFA